MKLSQAFGWSLAALVLLGGSGLQYASYRRQAEALDTAHRALELAARVPERPAPIAFGAIRAEGPSAEEIRSIVREELRAMAPPPARAQGPTGPDARGAEPAGPSPESLAALADATRLVDRAIAAGRWDDSSASDLRGLRGILTGEQMNEVGRKLSVAINQQKVHLAITGPIF